ncbi:MULTISPECIES: BglG family transcription antiterminator [Virgibacillus]|uniref:PRD domain-containing protein n=1 Tax=Virgibacillus dokdonensis TaxID=302167 RepID=A0ABU7VB58_9BACI|nr:PRD domain-containing protein [Virgibacillus sp.]NWO13434.1 PRD domain-containing protein [Virgibacillus sp.]
MHFNEREQSIIDILLQYKFYVPASKIAKQLDVSKKTVYRTINKLNENPASKPLIESKLGEGFRLNYEEYIRKKSAKESFLKNYTPVERRNQILIDLLFKAPNPIRTTDFYDKYFVSETVIYTDITVLNKRLKKHNLNIDRNGKYISIIGNEVDIRKVLINTINIFNLDNLLSKEELNHNDTEFIIDNMNRLESQLNITIPYPYNINIFSHLYILINRFRSGKVDVSKVVDKLKQPYTNLIQENKDIFQQAKNIINHFSNYLNKNLPDTEVWYLFQYLLSSRLVNNSKKEVEQVKHGLEKEITEFYIKESGKALCKNFNKEMVWEELINHIRPMINRINNNIHIKNNLLEEIKVEYEELFHIITMISQNAEQTFNLGKITEHENGYLTIYFAKYLEQMFDTKRIIIICTSGIGTSELLKVKVKKAFPNIEIVDVLSTTDFMNQFHKYNAIDFVLTTVILESFTKEVPILLVSPVFGDRDKEIVNTFIKKERQT